MIPIRKLASALWLAGLLTVCSTNAQEVLTTGNVISSTGWTGVTYMNSTQIGAVESGNYWGGPAFNTSTNTIRFSFNLDTVSQYVNLGPALSGLPTGIKISGFNYRFKLMSAGGDTLTGSFITKDNAGNAIDTTNVNFSGINTNGAFTGDETDPQGTVTYNKLYSPTSLGSFTASFTGKDTKWWAGLYGPRVRDFNVGFNYTAGSGGGSESPPTVPTSATTIPKLSTTTAATDATKTNYTVVNVGGVEMSSGEIAPIDNVPQVIKDANAFVRAANELEEKEKQKQSARLTLKPTEAVMPVRRSQPDTLAFVAPVSSQSSSTAQDALGLQVKSAPVVTRRKIEFDLEDPAKNSSSSLQTGMGVGPTNLLNMTMNTQAIDNSAASSSTSTVKRNVANNELAGGIDLTKMAVQPLGFNNYMNLTLSDASFYVPREVYPNQRVVDNARAQRLLQGASDRLHQEMVDSQYLK